MLRNTTDRPKIGNAIVIGGSIAGLLSARILSDYFKHVTVIERDRFPETPAFRSGAPQARHPHALLVRGQQILEDLFPGLRDELLAQGAIDVNMGHEVSLAVGGARVQPYASELAVTACSRPLLEHAIYRRLQAIEQIGFLDECIVDGVETDPTNTRVTGVHMRRRGASAQQAQTLEADLVIDASGRTSQMPAWLEALEYTPPTETTIDAQAGYATRIYRRTRKAAAWKSLYSIPQAPEQSRGCILLPMEGDRWYATLIGFNGDHPPTDEAGYLAFARSVPMPEFYSAISQAEAVTEPYGFRNAANRLRRYDRLPRYLEGLLVTGDAVYALNPVYGQGMTVAALSALALDECLKRQRRYAGPGDFAGLAHAFQQKLAAVIAGPWQMATGQDLRWPVAAEQSDSRRISPITRLMQRYLDRTLITMTHDAAVAEAFARVQNMLASPMSLFHPRIAWQVLRPEPQKIRPHLPIGRSANSVER